MRGEKKKEREIRMNGDEREWQLLTKECERGITSQWGKAIKEMI